MPNLSLNLMPKTHASDSYIKLPVVSEEQAIAVVMAYGIKGLDDAFVTDHHAHIHDGNPFETVLSFDDLRIHCGDPDAATEFDHPMYHQ